MSSSSLDQALDRAERALLRIERSAAASAPGETREWALREKVASVVAELDDIIRQSGSRR